MPIICRCPQVIDHRFSPDRLLTLILTSRHIRQIDSFLHPPPPCFPIKQTTVSLISNYLEAKRPILIYGDYDVDGITATALLWQGLYSRNPRVFPFIPHRHRDGYGFKADSFFKIQRQQQTTFDLLITVDNGIVAHREFKKLLNFQPDTKIVVIDHHLPSTKKLPVTSIIHSPEVSAAALAYFLAKNFHSQTDLGLAALGTVADCLPLLNLNRSLVYHGLRYLRLNPNPGLKLLIDLAGINRHQLSASDLGFVLGPRINAAGRLADPTDALRLLCSPHPAKYAQILNSHNVHRQELQQRQFLLAEKQLNLPDHLPPSLKLLLVVGKFNPGLIGLIAGRLTDKYHLPAVVIAQNGAEAKGSCRSVPQINIINLLRHFSPLFLDLGGHQAAAGFTIQAPNISLLKSRLTAAINLKLRRYQPQANLEVDAQMKLSAVTVKNIQALTQMEPFGMANPLPQFLFRRLRIVSKRLLGTKQSHLKLKLDDPETKFSENIATDAIAFKKGELDKSLMVGDLLDIVASLNINTWGGAATPQLIVKKIVKI